MAKRFLNRVRMSVASVPGTGTITVNTAAVGFQSFVDAGIADGDTCSYVIEDGSPIGSQWELGLGTWSNSGTFARTTILQSSAGGTTKISASANAILSATFFPATDIPEPSFGSLSDVSFSSLAAGQIPVWNGTDWVNETGPGLSSPSVVQSAVIQNTAGNGYGVTLGATPTVGNLLIAMGFGGASGGGSPGWSPVGFDRYQSWAIPDNLTIGYGMRSVTTGLSATQTLGIDNNNGPIAAILLEVANVDISKCSEFLMTRGQFGTGGSNLSVLSKSGSLVLAFVGGLTNTFGASSPTFGINQSADGTTVAFSASNPTNGHGVIVNGTTGSSTLNALMMSLPGI